MPGLFLRYLLNWSIFGLKIFLEQINLEQTTNYPPIILYFCALLIPELFSKIDLDNTCHIKELSMQA